MLVRIGLAVMLAYLAAWALFALGFAQSASGLPWLLHSVNLGATVAVLALTLTPWFRREWRGVVLLDCSVVLFTSLVLSNLNQQPLDFHIAATLIQVGCAAFACWNLRWQGALAAICMVFAAFCPSISQREASAFYWLQFASATALSLVVAALLDHYRSSIRQHLRALEGSEEKLWEIFENDVEELSVARLHDAQFIKVGAEFQRLGYTREEALGSSDAELGIWSNDKQRAEYWDRLRERGYVRNMDATLRTKNGKVASCVVSAVAVETSQGACVISLFCDVSRIRQAERDTVAAREAAEAASLAKSEFLSSMSHEIRQPMNAILGMAEVLAESELSPEQAKYLRILINNGNALLDLINDILDFERVESGKLKLEHTDFDLCELADRVAETLSIRAHQKNLELVVDLRPDVRVGVIGDPLRLRQVLINLLANAIKFTESGEVVLTIAPWPGADPGVLHFSVRDTGIGITSDRFQAIFTRYTQAETSTARKYGGSGLGLAIVKQLVELMGGRVWVESEIGKGSIFHFTASFGLQPLGLVASAPKELDLDGAATLLVDDNATGRRALREILTSAGAKVTEAANGEDALEALRSARRKRSKFTMMLLDCRMPNLDGHELALQMRRQRLSPAIVIPILTADDLNLTLPAMRRLGFAHHLTKPIRRNELFDILKKALSERDLLSPRNSRPAETTTPLPAIDDAEPTNGTLATAVREPGLERHMRVLVADDSPDNRLLIEAFLRRAGWTLDHADNGATAVERFKLGKYDVVLMDIQMPVMDGYAAVREIREWERECQAPRTPIIALTASVLDEAVGKSFEAGCDTHVSKPVRRKALLDAIREVAGTEQSATATSVDAAAS